MKLLIAVITLCTALQFSAGSARKVPLGKEPFPADFFTEWSSRNLIKQDRITLDRSLLHKLDWTADGLESQGLENVPKDTRNMLRTILEGLRFPDHSEDGVDIRYSSTPQAQNEQGIEQNTEPEMDASESETSDIERNDQTTEPELDFNDNPLIEDRVPIGKESRDTHTRQVRQAGLDFEDFPTMTGIQSVVDFGEDTLQAFFNLIRSFVDTVRPGPLPYEIITPTVMSLAEMFLPSSNVMMDGGSGVMSRRQAVDPLDFNSIQPLLIDVVTWLVPVLVLAGLGIVFALLFPLCGCCFCCCRCCGKCGAKNYRYKTKHELPKCVVLSVIFLLAHILLLAGIILGFLSNDKISGAIKSYPDTIRNAVADSVNYINGTVNEVFYLADDGLDNVLSTVTSDIENAGTVLGDPLETSLQNELDNFLNASDILLDNLDSVHNNLSAVNETINQIEALSVQLNDSLLLLEQAIANLTTECMGNPTCESAVPQFQATDVAIQIDNTPIEDAIALLDNVDINGTRALIDGSTMFLSNISGLIDDQISNFNLPNITQLDEINSIIETVQGSVGELLGMNGSINEIIDQAAVYLEMGEMYRYIAFVVLFLAITLIWLVFTIGMLCGVFGYSRKAIPTERSAVSNCGARLLFLGVAICFLTCGLILILTSFTFLFVSPTQVFCNDLAPSEYTLVQRLIDDPEVWDGSTLVGSFLSQTNIGPGNFDANISVSEVLRRCELNEPLYNALQVDSFFDINALLSTVSNLTSEIDITDNLDMDLGSTFSYTSDDFIPSAMRTDFENLAANVSSSFDFSSINQLLNSTTFSGLDIQELVNNLTTLANFFGSNGFPAAGNETLSIRDNLVGTVINSTLMALEAQLQTLQSTVEGVETSTTMINPQVQQTFSELDSFLNSTSDIVVNEVQTYVNHLFGYLTDFVDSAVDLATNEIGRCQPIAAAYGAVHNNFCVQTIDGVNGIWLSLGWCVLFFIPIVISTAMVTTYLRRSKSDIHRFNEKGAGGEVFSNREYYSERPDHLGDTGLELNTPSSGW